MVLEDASNGSPSSDFTSESSPQSDLDPYAGSNPEYIESRSSNYIRVNKSTPPIYINAANLPKPILQANWYAQYSRAIPGMIQQEEEYAKRPITQEEADAIASHYAASMRAGSWGTPVGLAVTAVVIRRGMRTFRFPFYTPFKQGSRWSPDRFGPIRGTNARRAWHFTRFVVYTYLGINISRAVAASYAVTTYLGRRRTDPQLRDLVQAVEKGAKEKHQGRAEDRVRGRQNIEESDRANQKGESVEMWRMRKRAEMEDGRRKQSSKDDMSPTGGAFEDDMRVQSESGFAQDNWSTPQDGMGGQSWQADGTSSETPSRLQTSSTGPSSSPTRPQRSTAQSTQQASPTNKQSMSAWDRLRQNAMASGDQSSGPSKSSSPQSPSSQSNSSASGSDTFSFSRRDEDRQLAKSEAQKEFDARVEKEREGLDFNDSRGKRW